MNETLPYFSRNFYSTARHQKDAQTDDNSQIEAGKTRHSATVVSKPFRQTAVDRTNILSASTGGFHQSKVFMYNCESK